jgi:hypothetical protein
VVFRKRIVPIAREGNILRVATCDPFDLYAMDDVRMTTGLHIDTVLAIKKAHGGWKPFTQQLAIENVVQSAARHAMCLGVDHLWRMGFKDIFHVHDEVMIRVPRQRNDVLAARQALIDVFGPGHCMPYGWAIAINIPEISITESLYEDERDLEAPVEKNGFMGNNRWRKIQDGTADCLLNLP